MDESGKTLKIDFPPRRTSRKQRKSTFRHGGRVENSENNISAAAETEKTTKIDFPPRRTSRKQ